MLNINLIFNANYRAMQFQCIKRNKMSFYFFFFFLSKTIFVESMEQRAQFNGLAVSTKQTKNEYRTNVICNDHLVALSICSNFCPNVWKRWLLFKLHAISRYISPKRKRNPQRRRRARERRAIRRKQKKEDKQKKQVL